MPRDASEPPNHAVGLTPEYIAALRRMSGAERLTVATRLWWTAWELKAARIRQLHPEWDEGQVRDRVREFMQNATA